MREVKYRPIRRKARRQKMEKFAARDFELRFEDDPSPSSFRLEPHLIERIAYSTSCEPKKRIIRVDCLRKCDGGKRNPTHKVNRHPTSSLPSLHRPSSQTSIRHPAAP